MGVPLNLISAGPTVWLQWWSFISAGEQKYSTEKRRLYLEIHHCDVHPNIMVLPT